MSHQKSYIQVCAKLKITENQLFNLLADKKISISERGLFCEVQILNCLQPKTTTK